jgi:hypothetical protein
MADEHDLYVKSAFGLDIAQLRVGADIGGGPDAGARDVSDAGANDVSGAPPGEVSDAPDTSDTSASGPTGRATTTSRNPPGIIDLALGLDPDKTFTERVMEPFFGTSSQPGPLQTHEGDSDAVKLARAAGIVVTLPIWGTGAVVAAAADHTNQIVNDFGEIERGIKNAPTHTPSVSAATDPASSGEARSSSGSPGNPTPHRQRAMEAS